MFGAGFLLGHYPDRKAKGTDQSEAIPAPTAAPAGSVWKQDIAIRHGSGDPIILRPTHAWVDGHSHPIDPAATPDLSERWLVSWGSGEAVVTCYQVK